ncbi:MAG: cold shock domain-containing protein [Candidatus Omnitrophota bacterium]
MHSGKVKKVVRDRGFGFISDNDGREVFFHKGSLVDAKFEELNDGQSVEFEVEQAEKGPRAFNIKISQVQA